MCKGIILSRFSLQNYIREVFICTVPLIIIIKQYMLQVRDKTALFNIVIVPECLTAL